MTDQTATTLLGKVNDSITALQDAQETLGRGIAKLDTAVWNTGDQHVEGVKTFASSPVAPTPQVTDNSTKAATTEFVMRAISAAVIGNGGGSGGSGSGSGSGSGGTGESGSESGGGSGGGEGGGSGSGTEIDPNAKVLAVAQTATGKAGQALTRIDVNGNAVATVPAFNTHPIYANITEQVIDGQHMVRIPKTFVKRGVAEGGNVTALDAWMISQTAHPGFELHPAFLAKDGVTALNEIWIGKYQACDDGGTKVGSKPGVMPITSITFDDFKTKAEARNTAGVQGFHMLNIHEWSLIGLLMLIEYANTDMQTVVGRGHVDNSPAGVQLVDHAQVATASWRGLVGIWGNVWQWCYGLMTKTDGVYINMGKGWYKTNIDTGTSFWPNEINKGNGTGWTVDHTFLGKYTTRGTNDKDSAFPDYNYIYPTYSRDLISRVGGYYYNGSYAGPFYLYCTYNPSGSYSSIGGRLAKW